MREPIALDHQVFHDLTRVSLDTLKRSLSPVVPEFVLPWIETLLHDRARNLARIAADFDARTGCDGLPIGSTWFLGAFGVRVFVEGQHPIPPSGPVIVAANHPGLTDTLALMASIGRDDLRPVADANPFLTSLDHVKQQLLLIPEGPNNRNHFFRSAVRHLKQGGSLLYFPYGEIEPDPAQRGDAASTLADWSDSVVRLSQLAGGVPVVPAAVSGVFHPGLYCWPGWHLIRDLKTREAIIATVQYAFRRWRPVMVTVRYGKPIQVERRSDTSESMNSLRSSMRQLLLPA